MTEIARSDCRFAASQIPPCGFQVSCHLQMPEAADDRGLLDIKELPRDVIMRDVATNGASVPPVLIAAQFLGNPKFLRIIGKGLGHKAGTTMRVAKSRKSKAEGSLQAVVLKQRSLKLSIRPVQVRNNKGSLVNHCEKNDDTKALLRRINAVWTPQANIVFEPASSIQHH